ncbi:Eco57I restriction-modification methylase domain-containing protein [Actinocrinis puniceicyclus]|uniref:site-specific DNA-methyltransferase (adenine-specific) n=1 Tax=Actinocrinis puniceicyclus TaxID=977794 RepID=A0A8J7WWW0_9ACTN|nr:Eco57I restriction-modification methylase domain-containing protein [Actinocrinis puniceicyclus]MBS2966574.1 Eco57I restriction-modification methylase domain-containing protein [Actinocrinis puniceicyclus]
MGTALEAAHGLLDRVEQRRQAVSARLDNKARAQMGQFFTPAPTAAFIADQLDLSRRRVLRVLDPGAGVGSLTCALVSRVLREQPDVEVQVTACEADPLLCAPLRETLEECATSAGAVGGRVDYELREGDFIAWAAEAAAFGGADLFDVVIMNPPYRKLGRATAERSLVAAAATDVSNLYAAFLALAVQLLADDGQLVAITPRSFTNGPYFKNFRRFFLDRMELERLHVYHSRTSVFADTDVLQENVIFTARRTDAPRRPPVMISVSNGHGDEPASRLVPFEQVVHPRDAERFWHIDLDDDADALAELSTELPASLADLGLSVSTGRVVDFRAAEHLHPEPCPGDVPLIYPLHMRDGRISWPVPGARKCNAIALNPDTSKLTFPTGYYPVVKRLSSKEERRRVVAALFDPEDTACEAIGFENHVNVVHADGCGLNPELARGMTLWLNSTVLDLLVRRFSGHTQVNATDLRNLRYPAVSELTALGSDWTQGPLPSQDKIDALITTHVSACSNTLGGRD